MRREISEVDGTEVGRLVSVTELPEPRRDALRSAARLIAAHRAGDPTGAIVAAVADEVRADWCALVRGEVLIAATPTTLPGDPDALRDLVVTLGAPVGAAPSAP